MVPEMQNCYSGAGWRSFIVAGFYVSNVRPNSVIALKEGRFYGSGFNPIRSTPPHSQ